MQVRLIPRAQLEAEAREFYVKRFKDVPEPKVINVDALVQFSAPRAFVWGGVGYRAPPLPFLAGVRMLVAANALRDLRIANAPQEQVRAAQRVAAHCIRQTVRPRLAIRRVGWRFRLRAFTTEDPQEVEGLLRWLLDVPDAASFAPSKERVTLDFMDAFAGFVREFPAWVGADGFPISWAAYVYGSRHLGRARAREDLRRAMSVRAAGADKKDYTGWNNELRQAAGW